MERYHKVNGEIQSSHAMHLKLWLAKESPGHLVKMQLWFPRSDRTKNSVSYSKLPGATAGPYMTCWEARRLNSFWEL